MRTKERLTVTVDSRLIEAANQAIADGRASSLSGWVNLAMVEQAAKEQRLKLLTEAIASYEKKFGKISASELAAQHRTDRQNSKTVRPRRRRKSA